MNGFMKQRISSCLLVLCMVLALLPVTQLPAAAVASDSGRTALTASSTTLSGGTYYLAGDVNLSTSIVVTGTVTLDLDGHVLKMTGNDSVIKVQNGGTLTLIDSNPTKSNTVDGETIHGGVITGGKATNGSGVYVASGGTFVANGGVVAKDNSVYVASGGTITNTATSKELTESGLASATVFFSSPDIQGTNEGRQVTFRIGSSIGLETPPDSWTGEGYAWEIVHQDGYPVNPDSRYAWYGTVANQAFYPWSFYTILTLSNVDYSTLYADRKIQSLKKSNLDNGTLSLELGKSYKLEEDISISSAITTILSENQAAIVLDLNGHVLKMTGNDSVIKTSNTLLMLIDSDPTKSNTVDGKTISGGVITGGKAAGGGDDDDDGGGGVHSTNGIFVMNGGSIVNCSATKGGGVWTNTNFVMNGGSIVNCSATNGCGVLSTSGFVMNGGSISGCSATKGGGVLSTSGFVMNGGSISGCSATNGGGVYSEDGFVMNGGSISSDVFLEYTSQLSDPFTMNGGVIGDPNSPVSLQVDGSVKISNTAADSTTICYCSSFPSTNKLAPDNYLVTFKNGSSTYAYEVVKKDGKAVEVPITEAGYVWYNGDKPFDFGSTVTKHLTLTKTARSYTITYDLDGGTEPNPANPTTYTIESEAFTLIAPTKAGYTFEGWTGTDLTGYMMSVVISKNSTGNRSYKANWEEKSNYTVDFHSEGGTYVTPKTRVKWTDKVLDKVKTTREGYEFKDWTYNGTAVGTNATYGSLVPDDDKTSITLTASWTPVTYTITYEDCPDDTGNPTSYTIESDDITLIEPTKAGYTFDGWTFEGQATPQKEVTIKKGNTGHKVYTANWTAIEYNISYDLDGGTEPNPANPTTYTIESETFTLIAPTKAGYTFKGWTGTDLTGCMMSVVISKNSTDDRSYTANWEENHDYKVVFDAKGGTDVTTKTNVKWTDRVLDGVEHPRRVDWEFKGWTLNGQPVTAESTYGELVGDEHDDVMSITLTAEWLYAPACSFIEATAGEGGSISPAGFSVVLDGNDKTFTITADSGYLIADVLVDGESVGAVSTYTFTDVRVDHTIEAKFELVQFEDCTEDDWFYPDIIYVAANGIMRGTGSGEFSPDVLTTRGMLVTMLYRLDGEPEVSGSCRFSDVQAGSYCEAAVIWASENGIVNGYDNGLFGTNDAITREQLAVILYRYAEFKGLDVSAGEDTDLLSYSDASETAGYALPAMKWMCGVGILHGNDNNQLMPKGSATRAEVAAILHRFCENILK